MGYTFRSLGFASSTRTFLRLNLWHAELLFLSTIPTRMKQIISIAFSVLFFLNAESQINGQYPLWQQHATAIGWTAGPEVHPTEALAPGLSFLTGERMAFEVLLPLQSAARAGKVRVHPYLSEAVTHPGALEWYNQVAGEYPGPEASTISARGARMLKLSFIPYFLDSLDGTVRRITAFILEYTLDSSPEALISSPSAFANQSVLASGNWYKLGVYKDGIYRVTYQDLSTLGFPVSTLDPRNLRLYGNGGGMLPEANALPRPDDLIENAIYVHGQEDGSFDAGDYILFYGQGPHRWFYNSAEAAFQHQLHLYSDRSVYFITLGTSPGKRISSLTVSTLPVTHEVNSFTDYDFYEAEQYNLIKSGKEWYGDKFDVLSQYNLSDFSFPDHDQSQQVYVRASVVAKSSAMSSFGIILDGVQVLSPLVTSVPASSYNADYARKTVESRKFFMNTSGFDLEAKYYQAAANSVGWLDFVEVNVRRMLRFRNAWLQFRDPSSAGPGQVSRFTVSDAPASLQVWDITQPLAPALIQAQTNAGQFQFSLATDTLREFLAFDGSAYNKPEFISTSPITNQNLHALPSADMLIISHPDFLDQAQRLAQMHNDHDGYSVIIVTPQEIYNEFSSGVQDIAGIRDFIRMIYERGNTQSRLRYVLLFGDGSFDPKLRIEGNTNFIPTFQTENSLQPTASHATDDFFVLMDADEGQGASGSPDIGIGRFPVQTPAQAKTVVDKIENYTTNGISVPGSPGANQVPALGDWRNVLTFIADDQDGNLHLTQAEDLVTYHQNGNRDFNIDKIYLDAYEQVSTPGGQRYPEVNAAINDRVNKGALMINYTGHGGETGLAQERVLEIQDIGTWNNKYNMPVFVTATCEFSRFDDPERVSAGELAFLKEDGGAIALFTTTRLSFSSSNYALNLNFYDKVFDKINGEFPRMGDVIRLSKTPSNPNIRNFILLGDPALRLAYPEHRVFTSSIKGRIIDGKTDTLRALEKVTITGRIGTELGGTLTGFNGIIYPTIFDKPAEVITHGNDVDSSPRKFYLQKNVLYKGKASVVNGEFSFTFVVPKDIAYRMDYGRISYYATDGVTDATGFYENIMIGGSAPGAPIDELGPEVQLFLNDSTFVNGGITDENPIMLAFVTDSNGVNTVGNGIGHDIVAVLDGNTDQVIVLNDYYESDLDDYRSGRVRYPFFGLDEGPHTLELKVWDVYNNSATARIEFVVRGSEATTISQLLNYPNPMRDEAWFVFEHNQPGRNLEIDLGIYSLDGRLVHSIRHQEWSDGFRTEPLHWDGRMDNGAPLPGGFYVYRVRVTAGQGYSNELAGKLIIAR